MRKNNKKLFVLIWIAILILIAVSIKVVLNVYLKQTNITDDFVTRDNTAKSAEILKCDRLQGSFIDDCYSNISKEYKDEKICNKISRSDLKDFCNFDIADLKNESSICNNIKNSNLITQCVLRIAYALKDPASCDYISSQGTKEKCYENIFKMTGDYSICLKIKDESLGVCSRVVEIDFQSCISSKSGCISWEFGTNCYRIVGEEKDICLLEYGGEVENPNWDGKLQTECRVPKSIGKKVIRLPDFSSIDQYCKPI